MEGDKTALGSLEELADTWHHVRALMASSVPNPHERYHLREICDRIEAAVMRKRQEEVNVTDRPEST